MQESLEAFHAPGQQHHDNPDSGPKTSDSPAQTRKLPECLEAHEVEVIIRASDNPRAKLPFLEQRIAEALALEVASVEGTGEQGQQLEDRAHSS